MIQRLTLMLRRVALALALLCGSARLAGESYEPYRPDMPAGAAVWMEAAMLHPTQFALGWREVAAKRDRFNAKTAAEAAAYLKKKDVPVVVGPGGHPFLADGHHTLRALLESAQPDKIAYGHILANWSDLDEEAFWRRMLENNCVYLSDSAGHPGQSPTALPASLLDMERDPYRGLAWAVMEAGGFEEKKGVYFQEFRWADYFRARIPPWDDDDDVAFQAVLTHAGTLAWEDAAADLPGYRPIKNEKAKGSSTTLQPVQSP